MTQEANCRFARIEDINQVIDLIEAHARHERDQINREGLADRLCKDLFCNDPKLYCIVAELGDELLGYATYTIQYSTWEAISYVYLDCLFLKEKARARGLGKKLMDLVKSEALERGLNLVQWQTPDFNLDAIGFYRALGAHSKPKERFFWEIGG